MSNLSLLLFAWAFIHVVSNEIKGISMTGELTIDPRKEEVNIFIVPIEYKRLLGPNCNTLPRSDCELSLIAEQNYDNPELVTVEYDVNINRVRPEFTGMLAACKTIKGFRKILPFEKVRGRNCDQKSVTLAFPLKTKVEDGLAVLQISFYTWFMEDKHYERMILKNFSKVLIPQYQEKDYKLRLFGVAIYQGRLQCRLHHKTTSMNIKESIQLDKAVREFYIDLKVESKIKGVYHLTCTANYTSGNRVIYENRKKSLELIIVKDPSIIIAKKFTFGVESVSGKIKFSIISTVPIVNITMTKQSGFSPRDISVNIIEKTFIKLYYELILKHLEINMTGIYTITVKTSKGQIAWKHFTLKVIPIKLPTSIEVTPRQKNVGENQSATFDCIVTGLAQVKWTKEGQNNLGSNQMVQSVPTADKNAHNLRLIFSSVHFNDSGIYICSAWSDHSQSTESEKVELLVLPHDSLYINYTFDSYNNDEDTVEPTTDIHFTPKEDVNTDNESGQSVMHIVFNWVRSNYLKIIIIGVVCATVLTIVVVVTSVLLARKYHLSRRQGQNNDEPILHDEMKIDDNIDRKRKRRDKNQHKIQIKEKTNVKAKSKMSKASRNKKGSTDKQKKVKKPTKQKKQDFTKK